ncbi:MAG: hypothetical protein ACRDQ4_06615 [Pseudonocardiaceae bacterium]
MASTPDFGRSLCLGVDTKGYGSADNITQAEWQRALLECLDLAAAWAKIDRIPWRKQSNGDGELALLPDDGIEPRVVDDFVRELDRALADYNRGQAAHQRLRLRLALHHGVAYPGANGTPGQAVVEVSRLVNSKPAHEALEAVPEAHLAVILSALIYEDVVLQRHTSLRPTDFCRVQVVEKEFTADAWLRVPGVDVRRLDLPSMRGTPHVDQQGTASDYSTVAQAGSNLVQRTDRQGMVIHQDAGTAYNFNQVDAPFSHFGPVNEGRGHHD